MDYVSSLLFLLLLLYLLLPFGYTKLLTFCSIRNTEESTAGGDTCRRLGAGTGTTQFHSLSVSRQQPLNSLLSSTMLLTLKIAIFTSPAISTTTTTLSLPPWSSSPDAGYFLNPSQIFKTSVRIDRRRDLYVPVKMFYRLRWDRSRRGPAPRSNRSTRRRRVSRTRHRAVQHRLWRGGRRRRNLWTKTCTKCPLSFSPSSPKRWTILLSIFKISLKFDTNVVLR